MRTIIASALALCIAAPALAAEMTAKAELKGKDGAAIGTVTLTQSPKEGVLVQVEASGLPAGDHGFHIHQTGKCDPDFSAAGDHFNPDGTEHGYLNEAGPHAGDMPNIVVGDDGNAAADVFTMRVSLEEGAPNSLFDEDGSAIIIHENADSYGADAGAGGRIACGVLAKGG